MNYKIYILISLLISERISCLAQQTIVAGNTNQVEVSVFIERDNPTADPSTFYVLNSNNSYDWLQNFWPCKVTFGPLFDIDLYYTYSTYHSRGVDAFAGYNGGTNWNGSTFGFYNNGGASDPSICTDLHGNWFDSYIDAGSNLHVSYSLNYDYGSNWQIADLATGGGYDKPAIWADNKRYQTNGIKNQYEGNVYCACRSPLLGNAYNIEFFYSNNHGLGWIGPNIINSTELNNTGVNVKTGPNGEVYVCWATYNNGLSTAETGIAFSKSIDGGVIFSTGEVIWNTNGSTGSYINGIRVNSFPVMAVNQLNGDIFIVWTQGGGDSGVINIIKSSDGGHTWTSAGTIGGPVSSNQFFPWIACDETSGALVVDFYCTDGSGSYYPYLAYSYDEGGTWHYTLLSGSGWYPVAIPNGGGCPPYYCGDYIGIDVYAGFCAPMWMDNVTNSTSHTFGQCGYNSNDLVYINSQNLLCNSQPWNFCAVSPNDYNVSDYAFFQSAADITAGGTGCSKFTVQPSGYCTMQSQTEIELKPGFEAKAGCFFHASISGCTEPPHKPIKFAQNNNDSNNNNQGTNKNGLVNSLNEGNSNESIVVIPNPTKGPFTLQLAQSSSSSGNTMNTNNYITVYNVFGQMIYQTTTPEFTINLDLSSQPRGVYLVRVQSGNNYFTKKLVVQ